MKNVILILFVLTMVMTPPLVVSAKSVECKVVSVDGDTVVLECAKSDQMKKGEKVTIKTGGNKRAPYGGC